MEAEGILLIKLFIAHLIGDFFLQSDKWVRSREENKLRSVHLYIHVLVHGVLVYLFLGKWNNWMLPLVVSATHFTIDVIKIFRFKSFKGFLLDQLLHIVSLVLIWMVFFVPFEGIIDWVKGMELDVRTWSVLLAYVLIIWPTAIFIGKVTRSWNIGENDEGDKSLSVSAWIGIIERVLILSFILMGQIQAIGFLIAAKSIFRFGELKKDGENKKTEFILVGSLLSFAMASITGFIIITIFA
jgi:hypothetical protein